MLIDSHAHLYWESFKEDLDQVIQRALDADVNIIINAGVDVKLSKAASQLSSDKITMYSTIGIHPHEAVKYHNPLSIHKDIEEVEQIYQSDTTKVIAVGECGLDFDFEGFEGLEDLEGIENEKQKQRQLFQVQIDLARKLNLPLSIHCRDDRSKDPQNTEAWDETLKMIGSHPTVLHCYSGLPPTTNYILETTNLIVSFAGNITYPKNEYLREAVKVLPLEKIILETDSPFLSPQSKRGQRNEPTNVLEIARLVADIKWTSLEEVARQTSKNVKILFNLK